MLDIQLRIRIDDHQDPIALSSEILVYYLKNYDKKYKGISKSIEDILKEMEEDYQRTEVDHEEGTDLSLFDLKVGYSYPVKSIDYIINELTDKLKYESEEYITMFYSFNNLEKLSIYYVMLISDRSITEILELIVNNYEGISKRDMIIKLLSESEQAYNTDDKVDIFARLYRFLTLDIKTFSNNRDELKMYEGGDITFREFTFPMHNYNTAMRLYKFANNDTSIRDINGGSVRDYYDRFNSIWKWKRNYNVITSSPSDAESVLYWLFKNFSNNSDHTFNNYRDILNRTNYRPKDNILPNVLINALDRSFFGINGKNYNEYNNNHNVAGIYPYTMLLSSDWKLNIVNDENINTNNLKFGFDDVLYQTNDKTYLEFRTLLSYYLSDLNMWFRVPKTGNLRYMIEDAEPGILPDNFNAENKGYFSNTSFIESAIQRVFIPKMYNNAMDISADNISNIDTIYDSIFDTIVNNSFIFTSKNTEHPYYNNHNYIPNRVNLNFNEKYGLNNKGLNIYEIVGNILNNKDDKKINEFKRFKNYYDDDLIYAGKVRSLNIRHNVLGSSNKTIRWEKDDEDELKLYVKTEYQNDNNENIFNIGDLFDDHEIRDNIADRNILDARYLIDMLYNGGHQSHNDRHKIWYRNLKFFQLFIGDNSGHHNRNINRVDREYMTDITNIKGYNIEGLSLADFTLGEKLLLKEYIEGYRSVKNINNEINDVSVIKQMINSIDNNETDYFPNFLSIEEKGKIKELLQRAYVSVPATSWENKDLIKIRTLLRRNSILNNNNVGEVDNFTYIKGINRTLKTNIIDMLNTIRDKEEYIVKFENFKNSYESGVWNDVRDNIEEIKEYVLTEAKTLFDEKYKSESLEIIKVYDKALFRLIINNYINYLINPSIKYNLDLKTTVLRDNDEQGFLSYYKKYINIIRFFKQYNDNIGDFIKNINDEVLPNYYKLIEAINTLPTWEYESMHRRDLESQLKRNNGYNINNYEIVWNNDKDNIRLLKGYNRISTDLYEGGMGADIDKYKSGVNRHKNRLAWWLKWVKPNGDLLSETPAFLKPSFKVPNVKMHDFNRAPDDLDPTFNDFGLVKDMIYHDPNTDDKLTLFNNLNPLSSSGNIPYNYKWGLIGNLQTYYYKANTRRMNSVNIYEEYDNIGVPLLLLGKENLDDMKKANTVRKHSFSFETDFLNMWYTLEGTGGKLPKAAYTLGNWNGDLVTGEWFKYFGFGRMDLLRMFRYMWDMEYSPMSNTYNIMNHYIFGIDNNYTGSGFSDGFKLHKIDLSTGNEIDTSGVVPWGYDLNNFRFAHNYSYNYDIGRYIAPVKISSGETVNSNITNDQLHEYFYLKVDKETFDNENDRKTAVIDILNRSLKNRVYLSYYRFRDILTDNYDSNYNYSSDVVNNTPDKYNPGGGSNVGSIVVNESIVVNPNN